MAAGEKNEFAGRVIITWPQPHGGALLPGYKVTLTNADSGERITCCLDLTVSFDPRVAIVAEVTMLTDEDGKPLEPEATPVLDGEDQVRTGRFRWLVAEMRTSAD